MSSAISLKTNRIPDPVLHDTKSIAEKTVERIVAIAVPFLSLNPISGLITSATLGLHHTYVILTELPELCKQGEWASFAKRLALLVVILASTACLLFFPIGHFLISNVFGAVTGIYELISHLRMGEWKEAGFTAMQLGLQAVFIASVIVATIEVIVLSLLVQACAYIAWSYKEFSKERIPEGIANIFLAGIRIYGAYPHCQTLHRNYFGKRLTQERWEEVYDKILQGHHDVEEILIEKGISSHIKDVSFVETAKLSDLIFKNMQFKNCDFTGDDFQGSRFHSVSADSCLFTRCILVNTVVQNCRFNKCDFSFSHFNDALLYHTIFERCDLKEASFLGANAYRSTIVRSDLTDVLLLNTKEQFKLTECTPHKMTKPVIALSWMFHNKGVFTPIIEQALQDSGAIVLRYECMPQDVDPAKLDAEIADQLRRMSIRELIDKIEAGSEMAKIAAKARLYSLYAEGLALPGGSDIQPIYYQAEQQPETHPDPDHRRSFMEFNMIFNAIEAEKPIMGTCRGSQMLNIAHGGTLTQHVDGQSGVMQMLEIPSSSHKEWALQLFGEDYHGQSMHHQASKIIGEGLEVVLKVDDIPKLLMSKDRKIIAVQFHPEVYIAFREFHKQFNEILSKFSAEKALLIRKLLSDKIFPYMETNQEKNRNLYRYFVNQVQQTHAHLIS